MQLSLLLAAASFVGTVSARPMDVFVPHITAPTAETVWKANSTQLVTWETSMAPKHITNKNGRILLRRGERATPVVLQSGFDILLGGVNVWVPWIEEGSDYSIVLFGDSGNWSKKFRIAN